MPLEALGLLRPDPATFETGDLVWPRADTQFVPYDARADADLAARAWESQRDAFVARVASNPAAPEHERRLVERIAGWTYRDFLEFPGEEPLGAGRPGPRPWVGHMGLVQVRGGTPWVVDATPTRQAGSGPQGPAGVAEQTYAGWLADNARDGAHVWHGRLPGLTAAQKEAAVLVALEQTGKPYDFLCLALDDTSGFYCSKLIWYAFWKAAGLSLDGEGPKRRFWFSPLQAMRSPHVRMMWSPPGKDYGFFN